MGVVTQHLAAVETAEWRTAAAAVNAALARMHCKPLRRNLSTTFDAPAQRQPTSNPRPNTRKNSDRLAQ